MKEETVIALVVAIFVGFIILVVTGANHAHNEYMKGQLEQYKTCVDKTGDYEWCFKSFNVDTTNSSMDKGHTALVQDLTTLLDDAKAFEFHDFKNENHAAPKMALRAKLLEMADNVVEGKYDN